MNKFKLGDTTPKGTINCVMFSRHTLGSRYLVNGHEYTEWELLGQPKPELNHTNTGTYGLKPKAKAAVHPGYDVTGLPSGPATVMRMA